MARKTLEQENHISRYAPYGKQLRDDNDNPIALLPQAIELREKDNGKLSVNWLEFFKDSHEVNTKKAIRDFKSASSCSPKGVFGIANVGILREKCAAHGERKAKVVFEERKKKPQTKNASHASVIRLPVADRDLMQVIAAEAFTEIVPSTADEDK